MRPTRCHSASTPLSPLGTHPNVGFFASPRRLFFALQRRRTHRSCLWRSTPGTVSSRCFWWCRQTPRRSRRWVGGLARLEMPSPPWVRLTSRHTNPSRPRRWVGGLACLETTSSPHIQAHLPLPSPTQGGGQLAASFITLVATVATCFLWSADVLRCPYLAPI